MKKSILAVIAIFAIVISSYGQTTQAFKLDFETFDGVYGYVRLKTKPTAVGGAYIWIEQTECVIEEINGSSASLDGVSFPIYSDNCYMEVKGKALVEHPDYSNPYVNPYKGSFSSNNLHYGSLGKTSPEVNFSSSTRDFINEKTHNMNGNYWEETGEVYEIKIYNVRGSDINKVVRSANN